MTDIPSNASIQANASLANGGVPTISSRWSLDDGSFGDVFITLLILIVMFFPLIMIPSRDFCINKQSSGPNPFSIIPGETRSNLYFDMKTFYFLSIGEHLALLFYTFFARAFFARGIHIAILILHYAPWISALFYAVPWLRIGTWSIFSCGRYAPGFSAAFWDIFKQLKENLRNVISNIKGVGDIIVYMLALAFAVLCITFGWFVLLGNLLFCPHLTVAGARALVAAIDAGAKYLMNYGNSTPDQNQEVDTDAVPTRESTYSYQTLFESLIIRLLSFTIPELVLTTANYRLLPRYRGPTSTFFLSLFWVFVGLNLIHLLFVSMTIRRSATPVYTRLGENSASENPTSTSNDPPSIRIGPLPIIVPRSSERPGEEVVTGASSENLQGEESPSSANEEGMNNNAASVSLVDGEHSSQDSVSVATQGEVAATTNQAACSICLSISNKLVALVPCGHVLCVNCVKKIGSGQGTGRCPYCQQRFTSQMDIFFTIV